MNIFRTDTHNHFFADKAFIDKLGNFLFGNNDLVIAEGGNNILSFTIKLDVEEVHLGASDKACNKFIGRIVIQILGRIHLLHNAVLHNDNAAGHRHGFSLVVSNINEGCLQSLMQLGDLSTHGNTQLGVQVGQRFVKQENFGLTNDCAAESNTLALTAGQGLGFTGQKMSNVQDFCSFFNAALDFILGRLTELQTESHVVIYRHMGIQRVVLENHGDVAIFGRYVIHQFVSDIQLAVGDFFQTGDHAQCGGFTAAGRSDQNDEFLVFDIQAEIADGGYVTSVDFVDVLKGYTCHILFLLKIRASPICSYYKEM